MKTITTKTGDVLEIRELTIALNADAARNLKLTGKEQAPQDNIEFILETARLCLVSFRKADGAEPLKGLSPAQARAVLGRTAGLMDFVLKTAKEAADEVAAQFEVDSGN